MRPYALIVKKLNTATYGGKSPLKTHDVSRSVKRSIWVFSVTQSFQIFLRGALDRTVKRDN